MAARTTGFEHRKKLRPKEAMGQTSLSHARARTTIFLSHVAAFLLVILGAYWLRTLPGATDSLLQGYLQVISSLLAFVFAAVTLVRFQGTQDRISLILGAGFFLRSEEHTSELQSQSNLVCRLLLEKKNIR